MGKQYQRLFRRPEMRFLFLESLRILHRFMASDPRKDGKLAPVSWSYASRLDPTVYLAPSTNQSYR